MTEEEKMMKRLSDLFSRGTPTYEEFENAIDDMLENAIRNMLIDALDQLEKSNSTLQKP